MTTKVLYDAVAQLVFEKNLEDEDSFYNIANRALLQVAKIRPQIGSVELNFCEPSNLLKDTFDPIKCDGELIFEVAYAKAYSFSCLGVGRVFLEVVSQNGWEIIKHLNLFSNTFVVEKGFIKNDEEFFKKDTKVRLRFVTEEMLHVKNVAMFDEVSSQVAQDIIEVGKYKKFDIKTMADDFLSLCSPPLRDMNLKDVNDYEIRNESEVLIPTKARGFYQAYYFKAPQFLSKENEMSKEVVDLDEELSCLLPNLIANLMLLDDEPAKADYYMALFREQRDIITHFDMTKKPARFKNIYKR